jgi:hypothetical protein
LRRTGVIVTCHWRGACAAAGALLAAASPLIIYAFLMDCCIAA